jgi:hypothetical protein
MPHGILVIKIAALGIGHASDGAGSADTPLIYAQHFSVHYERPEMVSPSRIFSTLRMAAMRSQADIAWVNGIARPPTGQLDSLRVVAQIVRVDVETLRADDADLVGTL